MYKYDDDVISHIDYEKYGCIKCGKNIKYTMNKIGFERFLSLYSYCCKECDFHISVVDDAQYTIYKYYYD